MKKERGRTLVELLAVIAIIGIISALAIPNCLNAIQRAKKTSRIAEMHMIGTALASDAVDSVVNPAQSGHPGVSSTSSSPATTNREVAPLLYRWRTPNKYVTTARGDDTPTLYGRVDMSNPGTGKTSDVKRVHP